MADQATRPPSETELANAYSAMTLADKSKGKEQEDPSKRTSATPPNTDPFMSISPTNSTPLTDAELKARMHSAS